MALTNLIAFEANHILSACFSFHFVLLAVFRFCSWIVLAASVHCSSHYCEKRRNGRDVNPRPLEWQASVLTTRPCHSPFLVSVYFYFDSSPFSTHQTKTQNFRSERNNDEHNYKFNNKGRREWPMRQVTNFDKIVLISVMDIVHCLNPK